MSNNFTANQIAEILEEKLGSKYTVYVEASKIIVIIPDSDEREEKFTEVSKLINEIENESQTSKQLRIIYSDEGAIGYAAHRIILSEMKKVFSLKIEYISKCIQITLPDNNSNEFVGNSLLIAKTVNQIVRDNSIPLNEPIKFRIQRSFRSFEFQLETDGRISICNMDAVTDLQARLLYDLSNDSPNELHIIKATDYGVSDSDFAVALDDLQLRDLIEVNFDFNNLVRFVQEGESQDLEYPAFYSVVLNNGDVINRFQE